MQAVVHVAWIFVCHSLLRTYWKGVPKICKGLPKIKVRNSYKISKFHIPIAFRQDETKLNCTYRHDQPSNPGVLALRGFEWQRHVCYQSLDPVEIADNKSALPWNFDDAKSRLLILDECSDSSMMTGLRRDPPIGKMTHQALKPKQVSMSQEWITPEFFTLYCKGFFHSGAIYQWNGLEWCAS